MGEKERQRGACSVERGVTEQAKGARKGLTWVVCVAAQNHGDICAQAAVEDHIWVHDPTATWVCAVLMPMAHVATKGHMDAWGHHLWSCHCRGHAYLSGLCCHLGTC